MPAAFERCLKHVEGKVRNKYAVCTEADAGNIKEYRKHEAAKREEHKSGRYKKAHS